MIHRISIRTRARIELRDVTAEVQNVVKSSGVEQGVCHVFVPHTTAAVMLNEHADPSVVEDIASHLDSSIPQHKSYRHTEGNAPAHIKAGLIGCSKTVFVENGELALGTWQGIFFCEFDGPRNRTLLVKTMADKP